MQTTNLSTFNNSWYNSGRNGLVVFLWYFTNIFVMMNPLNPFSFIKVCFLRLFGARVGKNVLIKPGVNIKYPWQLEIGDNCWIGERVWIDNLAMVKIGSDVCISQGAMLLCGNHDYRLSTFDLLVGEINLENGVWIGALSVVGPGVTIGSHAVLSVGSVAGKNLEGWKIYRGNPAEPVRERVIEK
jgi:putative colanic acid biosynthesis acetyltransferase WcaF